MILPLPAACPPFLHLLILRCGRNCQPLTIQYCCFLPAPSPGQVKCLLCAPTAPHAYVLPTAALVMLYVQLPIPCLLFLLDYRLLEDSAWQRVGVSICWFSFPTSCPFSQRQEVPISISWASLETDQVILNIKYLDKVIKTTTNKTTSSSSPGDRTSQWRTRGDPWEELLGKPDKGSKHSRVAFVLPSLFPLFLPAAWNLATIVAVPVATVWAWGNPPDRSKH